MAPGDELEEQGLRRHGTSVGEWFQLQQSESWAEVHIMIKESLAWTAPSSYSRGYGHISTSELLITVHMISPQNLYWVKFN